MPELRSVIKWTQLRVQALATVLLSLERPSELAASGFLISAKISVVISFPKKLLFLKSSEGPRLLAVALTEKNRSVEPCVLNS